MAKTLLVCDQSHKILMRYISESADDIRDLYSGLYVREVAESDIDESSAATHYDGIRFYRS